MMAVVRTEENEFASELAITPLVPSPLWNEDALSNLSFIYAVFLRQALEMAGYIGKQDELVPANRALLELYRSAKTEEEKARRVDVPTGRVDHQGFPI